MRVSGRAAPTQESSTSRALHWPPPRAEPRRRGARPHPSAGGRFRACLGSGRRAYSSALEFQRRSNPFTNRSHHEQPSSSPRRPSMYWTRKPSIRSRVERRPDQPISAASISRPNSADSQFADSAEARLITCRSQRLLPRPVEANPAANEGYVERSPAKPDEPCATRPQSAPAAQKPRFQSRTALSLTPQIPDPHWVPIRSKAVFRVILHPQPNQKENP